MRAIYHGEPLDLAKVVTKWAHKGNLRPRVLIATQVCSNKHGDGGALGEACLSGDKGHQPPRYGVDCLQIVAGPLICIAAASISAFASRFYNKTAGALNKVNAVLTQAAGVELTTRVWS